MLLRDEEYNMINAINSAQPMLIQGIQKAQQSKSKSEIQTKSDVSFGNSYGGPISNLRLVHKGAHGLQWFFGCVCALGVIGLGALPFGLLDGITTKQWAALVGLIAMIGGGGLGCIFAESKRRY